MDQVLPHAAIRAARVTVGPMLAAANRIAAILRETEGAADVRVEQATGLPFLDVRLDRSAAARRGLPIADVQDVVAIAVGGRPAGLLFEGNRRFETVVRLPDAVRGDLEALRDLPVPLRGSGSGPAATVPPRDVAGFAFTEGPNQVSREDGKRRIVVQANARGRDMGSMAAEVQACVASEVPLPTDEATAPATFREPCAPGGRAACPAHTAPARRGTRRRSA